MESNVAAFQFRVGEWMMACFGEEISGDKVERNHRFLEEALELVQACGCSRSEAHQLVDYVFDRPVGEKSQEVGGVMVTLAALCRAQLIWMNDAGETELARIWTKVDKIRAKQAAKPKHSPLPEKPAEFVQIPVEPSTGLLMSMAIRYDHALGAPGYYDHSLTGELRPGQHAQRIEAALTTMRQLYEEVSGRGFYKPNLEAQYAALAVKPEGGAS